MYKINMQASSRKQSVGGLSKNSVHKERKSDIFKTLQELDDQLPLHCNDIWMTNSFRSLRKWQIAIVIEGEEETMIKAEQMFWKK